MTPLFDLSALTGRCTACDRLYTLTTHKKMPRHGNNIKAGGPVCEGSNKPPKPHDE